jgi:hypothetical protein
MHGIAIGRKCQQRRLSFLGDVLKNVMPKFPSDMADAPIFFAGVDKLFDSFSVPERTPIKIVDAVFKRKGKIFIVAS